MEYSAKYIFIFSTILCLICSILVSGAAVGLHDLQEVNKVLDRQKSVLLASQLMKAGEKLSAEQVKDIFKNIDAKVVSFDTDDYATDIDPATFKMDEVEWVPAPVNNAGISEVPKMQQVFHVKDENGKVKMLVLPIYGKGLWSTLQGFLALDKDTTTIRGITYYQHGETPGLGGEVDNPKWKNLWPGRKAYDDTWKVVIEVIKGAAGSPADDPHHVDGLSGATITSRGVSHMLEYWLGDEGYGPFLKKFRETNGSA